MRCACGTELGEWGHTDHDPDCTGGVCRCALPQVCQACCEVCQRARRNYEEAQK